MGCPKLISDNNSRTFTSWDVVPFSQASSVSYAMIKRMAAARTDDTKQGYVGVSPWKNVELCSDCKWPSALVLNSADVQTHSYPKSTYIVLQLQPYSSFYSTPINSSTFQLRPSWLFLPFKLFYFSSRSYTQPSFSNLDFSLPTSVIIKFSLSL